MLQIIFGDDEHTAAEGPYSRVMKTRKWLYVLSSASLAVSLGLYNPKQTTELLKVISLPQDVVGWALSIAVLYLGVQYIFLVIQLIATYDIVLVERFKSRREDELSRARDAVTNSRNEVKKSIDDFRADYREAYEKRNAELSKAIEEAQTALATKKEARIAGEWRKDDAEDISTLRHDEERAKASLAVARMALRKLEEDTLGELDPSYDSVVASRQAAARDAEAALHTLISQEPAERKGYKALERLIDFVRIGPPPLLAFTALLKSIGKL